MTGISWLRVRELVRKEFLQMFRDPRMKPIVFVAPVVQLLLLGYAVNTDIQNTAMFVVDHDRSAASARLIDEFTSTGYFAVVGQSQRAADLVAALDRGRAVVGVAIPIGFSSDLLQQRTAQVQVLIDGTNSNTGTIAQGYAMRIVRAFALDAVPAAQRTAFADIAVRTRAWFNPELRSRVYNVPAVVGILLLLMCLLLTALAVVREREFGTLDQLLVSPLKPTEFILGKTIPVAAVSLIDLALITGVAVFWFDIPFRGSMAALLPAAVIYIVAGLSFGLIISTISKSQQEAFMTMFLFLLPAIILSGFFYPISSMPIGFQWLTVLNPARHFLEIVRAIFLKGSGITELWPQYLALAAIATGGIGLAIRRFEKAAN